MCCHRKKPKNIQKQISTRNWKQRPDGSVSEGFIDSQTPRWRQRAYRDDAVCYWFLQCIFGRLLQLGEQHAGDLLDAEHPLLLHVHDLEARDILEDDYSRGKLF